jgi:hypothetical protein
MGDRSRDASALLGMEGFVVLSQSEEDGELYVLGPRAWRGRRGRCGTGSGRTSRQW